MGNNGRNYPTRKRARGARRRRALFIRRLFSQSLYTQLKWRVTDDALSLLGEGAAKRNKSFSRVLVRYWFPILFSLRDFFFFTELH